MPIALPAPPVASAAEGAPCGRSGVIEIELVGGRRVRIDGAVDAATLRRVIEVLEGR
jgi:transposase